MLNGFVGGMNETTNVKYVAQYLACSRCLVNMAFVIIVDQLGNAYAEPGPSLPC